MTRIVLGFPAVRGEPDPLFGALAAHWRRHGLDVVPVALDGDGDAIDARYLAAVDGMETPVLGGFSAAARAAARISRQRPTAALLCLGHPFHRRGVPGDRHGWDELAEVRVPTLVVQGTRDPHGSREAVRGFGPLPQGVEVVWIEDGNHRFMPRERSGRSEAESIRTAADVGAEFLLQFVDPRAGAITPS